MLRLFADYKEEQDCEVETLKAIYTEEELNGKFCSWFLSLLCAFSNTLFFIILVLSKNPWNFEIIVKSEADDAECMYSK